MEDASRSLNTAMAYTALPIGRRFFIKSEFYGLMLILHADCF